MTPATLNLNLTRGITFGPIQFLFSSKILGAVTASPSDSTFTLPGHTLTEDDPVRLQSIGGTLPTPMSAAKTYYVVNPITDQFKLSEDPTGPAIIITDAGSGTLQAVEPADLTNWIPYAEVRSQPEGALILDLVPEFTDASVGEVTIPAIQDEQTILLPAGTGGKNKCKWDLIFQVPTGERIGPYIAGSFLIKSIITEPAVITGP